MIYILPKRPVGANAPVASATPTRDVVAPYQADGVSGIFDELLGVVKTQTSSLLGSAGEKLKKELLDQLFSAQAKIENKIGTFLTTNQTLRDLKVRAQQQQNSSKSEIQSRASAIVAKANGLLNQYESIKTSALSTADKLTQLKNTISASEVFKVPNPLQMGTRFVELLNTYKSEITNAASAATSLYNRMNQHLKDTDQLKSDVASLEAYAQGKGLEALAGKVGGAYLDTFKVPLAILAVGAAVYLFTMGGGVKKLVRG